MPVLSFDCRTVISGLNTAVNTWHLQAGNIQPTNAEANAALGAVKAFYDAIVSVRVTGNGGIIGSRVLFWQESWWTKPTFNSSHVQLTPGSFNTEPVIIGATPATAISGTGGLAIPPQLATVVSWRTAISGRSGRGRTYLGALGAGAQNGAVVGSGAVTIINSAAANLITAVNALTIGGSPARLGVWSPVKGVIREITSGVSDGVFDTMRSRVK